MPIGLPISYPLINGHRYSWASAEISFGNGLTTTGFIRGIKSIDYGDKLSPTAIRGTGPSKIGRTRGEYDSDASIEMYRLEWENLKSQLGPNGDGVGFGEAPFDLPVSYAELGQSVVTDTLNGCRITEVRAGGSEGADALTVKLTLDVMSIDYSGSTLLTPS